MDELFIWIVFFVLSILFSGVGSKKKRQEARQRDEARREQAEAERRARAEQRRAMRESREADGRVTFPAADTTSSSAPSPSGDTSLDMIPDELWNILTGGAPRPAQPSGQPSAEAEPASGGGWVTSPPWDEEDAVDSIEGVSAEDMSGDVVDYDDEADRIARARYEDIRATTWDERLTSRDAIAVRADETSQERHYEFHDRLRATEIGAAELPASTARSLALGLREPADVRRAIVLAEILGLPKALRY